MMSSPLKLFSSDFSHFYINFKFFGFFFIFAFFILFFTCIKKRGGLLQWCPPPYSNFSHRISATLKSIFKFFGSIFYFRLYFHPFILFLTFTKKWGGTFAMMSPPLRLFSSGFGHFEINFQFFFSFLPVFLLILALFILFFTCTRKWGGLLQWCPPHFKKWGGQVPPVSDAHAHQWDY